MSILFHIRLRIINKKPVLTKRSNFMPYFFMPLIYFVLSQIYRHEQLCMQLTLHKIVNVCYNFLESLKKMTDITEAFYHSYMHINILCISMHWAAVVPLFCLFSPLFLETKEIRNLISRKQNYGNHSSLYVKYISK